MMLKTESILHDDFTWSLHCMHAFSPWKEQRFFVASRGHFASSLHARFFFPYGHFASALHGRVFFLGAFFSLALCAFSCLGARVFFACARFLPLARFFALPYARFLPLALEFSLHARCSFQLAYLSNATPVINKQTL
jgi:hypothetical protein